MRTHDPELIKQRRETYEKRSAEFEQEAYRQFGPDWKEKLERLKYESPELKALREKAEKQGGLTPEEMAAYKREFEKAYGGSYKYYQERFPYAAASHQLAQDALNAYAAAAGPTLSQPGETEKSYFQRMRDVAAAASIGSSARISELSRGSGTPESTDITRRRQAEPEISQLERVKKTASELEEQYTAAYEQRYGKPLPSEQLAMKAAGIKLGPTPAGQAERATYLAGSAFVGEFEGLERSIRGVLGQPIIQKYRQPVTAGGLLGTFDLFGVEISREHPLAKEFTPGERAFAAILGGGAAIGLQTYAFSKGASAVARAVASGAKEATQAARMSYYTSKYFKEPIIGEGAKFFQYTSEVLPHTKLGGYLFKSKTLKDFLAPTRMTYKPTVAAQYKTGAKVGETILMKPAGKVSEYQSLVMREELKSLSKFGIKFEVGGPVTKEMIDLGLVRAGKPWSLSTRQAGQLQNLFIEGKPSSKARFLLGAESKAQPLTQTTIFGKSSKDYPKFATAVKSLTERVELAPQTFFSPKGLDKGFMVTTTWETKGVDFLKPAYRAAKVTGFIGEPRSESLFKVFRPAYEKTNKEWASGFLKTFTKTKPNIISVPALPAPFVSTAATAKAGGVFAPVFSLSAVPEPMITFKRETTLEDIYGPQIFGAVKSPLGEIYGPIEGPGVFGEYGSKVQERQLTEKRGGVKLGETGILGTTGKGKGKAIDRIALGFGVSSGGWSGAAVAQGMIQAQRQLIRQLTAPAPITSYPYPIPKLAPPFAWKPTKRKAVRRGGLLVPSFDVFIKLPQVKIGKGSYRSAGYRRINIEPLTFKGALGLGFEKVDTSARASFFISPVGLTKKPSRKYEREYGELKERFRVASGEKRRGGMLKLVEKTAYRISSKGEKQEIPYEAQRLRQIGAIPYKIPNPKFPDLFKKRKKRRR